VAILLTVLSNPAQQSCTSSMRDAGAPDRGWASPPKTLWSGQGG